MAKQLACYFVPPVLCNQRMINTKSNELVLICFIHHESPIDSIDTWIPIIYHFTNITTNNLKFEHHDFSPQTKIMKSKKSIHKTVSMETPQKTTPKVVSMKPCQRSMPRSNLVYIRVGIGVRVEWSTPYVGEKLIPPLYNRNPRLMGWLRVEFLSTFLQMKSSEAFFVCFGSLRIRDCMTLQKTRVFFFDLFSSKGSGLYLQSPLVTAEMPADSSGWSMWIFCCESRHFGRVSILKFRNFSMGINEFLPGWWNSNKVKFVRLREYYPHKTSEIFLLKVSREFL